MRPLPFHFLLAAGLLLWMHPCVFAQKGITTFGFVVRPGFPNKFLRTGPIEFEDRSKADTPMVYSVVQQSGISFGGIVRHGITQRLSLETGIVYTKRNYNLSLSDSVRAFTGNDEYSIIGYEIPLSALVFIQLDKRLWMDVGLGGHLNIFPSDVTTFQDFYQQYSVRKQKLNAGVMAHLGVEYRTEKSGYIYAGFIYLRALSSIYETVVEYYPTRDFTVPYSSQGRTDLQGDYFGVDLKYFFHENPEKKNRNKRK